jgi:hypothetical protein
VEDEEVGEHARKETGTAIKESARSVPPEDEKVGAFVGKNNDAAEVTKAVVSSTLSLDEWGQKSRSVHPEVEKVGAFVGKDNDAAEVTDAVVSSTPSLD